MDELDLDSVVESKMKTICTGYGDELSCIQTGRPTIFFLSKQYIIANDNITRVYLKSVASLFAKDYNTLIVEFFDKDIFLKFDKKIRECGFGTSAVDGLRLKVFTTDIFLGEKRVKMQKVIANLEEQAKVSIRTIRQTYNNKTKRLHKDKDIDDTELKIIFKKIQTHTDAYIKKITEMAKEKLNTL